jgi:hypothetical protein
MVVSIPGSGSFVLDASVDTESKGSVQLVFCYDFGRLGNRLQSMCCQRSKMSLEECKSLDLYCLARFESDQRVEENVY